MYDQIAGRLTSIRDFLYLVLELWFHLDGNVHSNEITSLMALLLEVVMHFGSSQWNIKEQLGEDSGKAFVKEEWSANAGFPVPQLCPFALVDVMAAVAAAILDYNISSIRGVVGRGDKRQ